MALKQIVAFALASMAAAESLGEWSIYCGDSCSDGTLVASGEVAATTCASLGGSYDYCYLQTEDEIYTDFWEVIFFENSGCVVGSDDGYGESNVLFNGSCTTAGPWTAYDLHGNA